MGYCTSTPSKSASNDISDTNNENRSENEDNASGKKGDSDPSWKESVTHRPAQPNKYG